MSYISYFLWPQSSAISMHKIGLHLFPPRSKRSYIGSDKLLVKEVRWLVDFLQKRLLVKFSRLPSDQNFLGITFSMAPDQLNSLEQALRIQIKGLLSYITAFLVFEKCRKPKVRAVPMPKTPANNTKFLSITKDIILLRMLIQFIIIMSLKNTFLKINSKWQKSKKIFFSFNYIQWKRTIVLFIYMEGVNLIVPKEVSFASLNGVQKLVIINPTNKKLVIKIRTNHKTALNINPTHDFVDADSKKDFIVKLLELHEGVKLQVNYSIATQQMIAKNDSKFTNVQKKDIKKQITVINVANVKSLPIAIVEEKKKQQPRDELNTSFGSVQSQKVEPVRTSIEKKASLNASLTLSKQEDVVIEEKIEQDEGEFEEQVKQLRQKLSELQTSIQQKKQSIFKRKQEMSYSSAKNQIIDPMILIALLVSLFILGNLLRAMIF